MYTHIAQLSCYFRLDGASAMSIERQFRVVYRYRTAAFHLALQTDHFHRLQSSPERLEGFVCQGGCGRCSVRPSVVSSAALAASEAVCIRRVGTKSTNVNTRECSTIYIGTFPMQPVFT